MLVPEIFSILLPILKSFDPEIEKWIKQPRLTKPRGVLNYIIKYLIKMDDSEILKKLDCFSKQESQICAIISKKISDLDKKEQIISLMDKEHDYLPIKQNCVVCNKIECEDIDFCESKKNNWQGI